MGDPRVAAKGDKAVKAEGRCGYSPKPKPKLTDADRRRCRNLSVSLPRDFSFRVPDIFSEAVLPVFRDALLLGLLSVVRLRFGGVITGVAPPTER